MDMSNRLEQEVATYQRWREGLAEAITAYQEWLDHAGQMEASQSLKLYDLAETLKQDRITVAFVAEFSRGKTELINALFFSDFKQRLLPSDVGRTTMCPTEIFYDPDEAPYIRLLPIETRYNEDSIAQLKKRPIDWVRIRLNPDSPEEMAEAMGALTQVKTVAKVEARTMGLWDDKDPALKEMVRDDDRVEIPAWRHALVNYPHPLLKAGLVILDTPGLNALGSEPELTVSMIPKAHGVLFLLAMDTGVTKSDLEIWQKYVKKYVPHRLAVLNKIDVAWDELKSWDKIQESVERQRESTAKILDMPVSNVLPLSAQKALVAKIRGDSALLEKSGITKLESLLANEIVPTKQQILKEAVAREIGQMAMVSHKGVHDQLASAQHEHRELSSLSGKNKEVVGKMLESLRTDKAAYEQTVESFNNMRGVIIQQGRILLSKLNPDRLDDVFDKNRGEIEDSWTTVGLNRGMQTLIKHAGHQFEQIHTHSTHIKRLIDGAYLRFHEKHGLKLLTAPALNMDKYKLAILDLSAKTEEFCRDPVNVMTEKRFLVKRFFGSLAEEARNIFAQARKECETWLRSVLTPLLAQINDHKVQIERRIENIRKIHDNIDTLRERLNEVELVMADLQKQAKILDEIAGKLEGVVKSN